MRGRGMGAGEGAGGVEEGQEEAAVWNCKRGKGDLRSWLVLREDPDFFLVCNLAAKKHPSVTHTIRV